MSLSLFNIGRTGLTASRASLEVTAQNIANAETEGYVRRRINQVEVAAPGRVGDNTSAQFNGVRIDSLSRPDLLLVTAEVRRSTSSFAAAEAEVGALTRTEAALEEAGIFDAIVEFEASLAQLETDPLNSSLRANALEQGRALAETFQLSSNAISQSGDYLRLEAQTGVVTVNDLTADLARTNLALTRVDTGAGGRAALLDQRDLLLEKLSGEVGIATEFGLNGTVNVRLNDSSGPLLVELGATATLSANEQANGILGFAVDGNSVTPLSGAMAGRSNALQTQVDVLNSLDAIAAGTITALNASQASGTAQDGSAGQPFFSGTGARDIALAISDGRAIATAPSGSAANSLDTSNLAALRDALANGGPAAQTDTLMFDLSNSVRNRSANRDALGAIAQAAQTTYAGIAEVDLDQEAANLVRYQQSFEASGRVIQVATELFDTILGIG